MAPGETLELTIAVTAPRPPGPYRLAFDLVEEHRFWFAEVGGTPLELEIRRAADRRPDARRAGARRPRSGHDGGARSAGRAVALEEEAVAVAHLVAGAVPPPSWSRLLLDAHAEGWAAVGRRSLRGRDTRARSLAWRRRAQPSIRVPAVAALAARRDRADGALGLPAYDGDEPGCSTAESRSQFRGDPVVDGAEHRGAEDEGDDRLDEQVDEVAGRRNLAVEERRRKHSTRGVSGLPHWIRSISHGCVSATGRLSRL